MHLDYQLLLIAPLVVFCAYVMYGVSGFGSGLVNVSILANFLPLTVVVPLSLLLDFTASMLVGTRFQSGVQWRELAVLAPFGLLGTVTGVALLINLPRAYALTALGVFLVSYGLFSLTRPHKLSLISRLWAPPTALLGGAIGGLFGTGGPVFAVYLSRRLQDKVQLKATLASMFTFQTASRIVAYSISGLLLQKTVLLGALALSPLMWFGLKLGNRLHATLPRQRVLQAMALVLVATGASLIARSQG